MTAQEPRQAWSDEDIVDEAHKMAIDWNRVLNANQQRILRHEITVAMRQVRDDLAFALRAVEQERDELRQELDRTRGRLESVLDRSLAHATRREELLGDCIHYAISYGIGDEDAYRAEYREVTGKGWDENE